jgi:hypothetical protein
MSQLESSSISSPLYSYTFPAMVGGTISTTNVSATYLASNLKDFYQQSSKIVGIVRTTPLGTVGQPYLSSLPTVNNTADGFIPVLTLRSSTNLDLSIYTVYWQNEVVASQIATVLEC